MKRKPWTAEEWQEAVDMAYTLLLVDSARQYGLVTGGPKIQDDRCNEILRLGAEAGYKPKQVWREVFGW